MLQLIYNPFLTRELRITGFEGNPSKINLRQHADKTCRQDMRTRHADKTCRQDTQYLVMPHGREESVKGTNAAHDKPMSTDLSAQAQTRRVEKWRHRPFVTPPTHAASAHSAPVRSTAQERKVHGVLQLAFHKVQHTNPGLACSPDQAKSGCWAPQADRRDYKTCRAVRE